MKAKFTLALLLLLLSAQISRSQNMALDFDGTNDYVSCGIINLSFQSFAIEGWFNIDELPPTSGSYMYDDIFGIEYGVDAALLRVNGANSKLEFVLGWNSGTQVLTSNTTMVTGQWYHVAILFHHSARIMYIVINGKVDASYTISGGDNNYSNQTFRIGGEGNYRSFDGKIDEVKVWANVIRGENDIRNQMYEELLGSETSLAAYYKMNETSGTTANDSQTSSTYDGTLYNMTGSEWTPSSAFFGPQNCFYFNGSTSYVSLGSEAYNNNFSNGTAITIEYWFKGSVLQSPVRFQDMSGNYVVAGWGTGNPEFIISTDGGGGGGLIIDTNNIVEDGSWHHVACTWEKNTTNGFKTYVDGKLTNQRNSANVNLPAINYNGLLGAYHGPAEVMNGQIDEVRIWTDVRTEAEILEHMNKTLTGNEENLVMYYNFDGYTLPNIASANYDGILMYVASQESSAFNTWLNTNSSTWSSADNWSDGVPVSSDNVGVYSYSGGTHAILSGDPTVNNMIVGSSTTFTLASDATVTSGLTLLSDIDLNNYTITIESGGILNECGGKMSGTSGYSTCTESLDNICSNNIGGLGAVITSTANMGSTVIERHHAPITGYTSDEGINRYYKITPTSNTGLDATLVFHYEDSELNGNTEANLVLFKSTDQGQSWTEVGGTLNTTDNTLTLTSIDGFSWWTAAESGETLPVELLSFTGAYEDGKVKIKWETASETNSDYFLLLKSHNGMDFHEMAKVPANYNSHTTIAYHTLDKDVEANSIYYYKLIQVDMDGSTEEFDILSVNTNDHQAESQIKQLYPIPCKDYLNIEFNHPVNGKIRIYNAIGKMLQQAELNTHTGRYTLSTEGLEEGVYYIVLDTHKGSESCRFVK